MGGIEHLEWLNGGLVCDIFSFCCANWLLHGRAWGDLTQFKLVTGVFVLGCFYSSDNVVKVR